MVYGSHCCSLVGRLLTVLGGLKKNSRSESNAQITASCSVQVFLQTLGMER